MMIPPFEHGEFIKMKKKEAQEYFDWFTSQVSNRIDILRKVLVKEGLNDILDFSAESLVPLWEWYEKKIIFIEKETEELLDEITKQPNWMKSEILTTKVSPETLKYALDISIYFAEIIRRDSKGKIDWGYFSSPSKRISVNEPTLLGFKSDMDLNPRLIVLNCTRRSGRELLKTRLFDMYNTWMTYIE